MALIQFVRIFRYIALLQPFLLRLPPFFVPSLCVFLIIAHLYYTPQYTFYTNYAALYSVVFVHFSKLYSVVLTFIYTP